MITPMIPMPKPHVPRPFLEILAMIPAELRRRPGAIGIPDVVTEANYDSVVGGAPTWWISSDFPILAFDAAAKVLEGKPFAGVVCCRRYWKHNLKTVQKFRTKLAGDVVDGAHVRHQGGQMRSLSSPSSYLGSGEYQERYQWVEISPDKPSRLPLRSGPKVRR